MIDIRTGTLTFQDPPIAIAPSLTRDAFLGSPLAEDATTHIENEPYHSWKLAGTFRSFEVQMLVVVWFHHQRLTEVSLMDSDPRFGRSLDSPEKEFARKASHEAWLSRSVSSQRKFSWGSIWSDYDQRAAFSEIRIIYKAAG